jgi:hypothetical protein
MKRYLGRLGLLGVFACLLIKSCLGFQKIAWGTGTWWGEYSLKWGVGYFVFILLSVLLLVFLCAALWSRERLEPLLGKLIAFRENLGRGRWLLVAIIFFAPVGLFQYTPWGVVFKDVYIRILVWFTVVSLLAFIIKRGNAICGWAEFLVAILVTSGGYVIAVPFMNVTDYPFALGWSEGNRLWDYSIMFGRSLYNFPLGGNIPVLLDVGRQFVGGLPFLVRGLPIEMERFWIALTVILPYFILGFAAFRFDRTDWKIWVLASLWVLIFLKQGPIHPPLVLGAVMVVLAWRAPLWYAVPLLIGAGYFVQASRFTWIFAPSLWIVMLEIASASYSDRKTVSRIWTRSVVLCIVGIIGALVLPGFIASNRAMQVLDAGLQTVVAPVVPTPLSINTPQVSIPVTPVPVPVDGISNPTIMDSIIEIVTIQPLLWYRLLPNSTYDKGILFSLLFSIGPLIVLLFYLSIKKIWQLNFLQKLVLVLPLLAFFAVGIIASIKIGGGGDLHNMDMFLIGLMFTAVIAWQNGGRNWLMKIDPAPVWIKLVLVLLFALPGFEPLYEMRSFSFAKDIPWLSILTDEPPKSTLEMYPPRDVTDKALEVIRAEVASAQAEGGEILFMDQRQLLTFGYVHGVPLVPEYEKKMLMNEALSSNAAYFQPFYTDLANHRFALIISELLRTPVKDSSFQFGEENNAWVAWVSSPVLCYYEEKETLKEVGVQLLVPRKETVDCSDQLP